MGGEVCPRVFCITVLVWLAITMFAPDTQGKPLYIFKTMKRMAYGFRDMEFFKLKIMGLHETKYALIG